MSSLSIESLSKLLASLLGAGMVYMGISTFASPETSTAVFGIAQKAPINPFIYVFASRETSLGLAILALASLSEWKAVGVLSMAIGFSGLSDLILDAKYGRGMRAFMIHGVPTIVMIPVVWTLVKQ